MGVVLSWGLVGGEKGGRGVFGVPHEGGRGGGHCHSHVPAMGGSRWGHGVTLGLAAFSAAQGC